MSDFLALGDLHIGRWPKNVPASYTYLSSIFYQLEEYAIQNGIDTVFQLGDVHDSVSVEEEARLFFLSILKKSKLKWHIYYGNHDYLDTNFNTLNYYVKMQEYFSILKNVKFYTEPYRGIICGIKTAILPWPYSLSKDKDTLCFGHYAIKGAKSDNGFSLKSGHSISDNNYWILGDLHQFQQDKDYVYAGAVLQLKYNDSPDKYFLHFKGDSIRPKFKKVKIKLPYVLEQLSCSNVDKIPKMIKYLEDRNSNVYTRLKLGAEVLSDYRYEDISKMGRIDVEFSGKVKVNDQDLPTLIDSKNVRQELVIKTLQKKGFNEKQIKKAITLIDSLSAQ